MVRSPSPPSTAQCSTLPKAVALQFEAAARLNLDAEVLDPEYGYLFTLSNGKRRVTMLGGRSPLNQAVAARLCEDKYYTGLLLKRAGFQTPESVRCLKPGYFAGDRYEQATGAEPGLEFAVTRGYPLMVKPNRLSHGRDIALVESQSRLVDAIRSAWERDYIALVQTRVPGVDLRLDFLDGEFLAGYERLPVVLTGDGVRTVRELALAADSRLCDRAQMQKLQNGTEWRRHIQARGRREETVLDAGVSIDLGGGILNLNCGATARPLTTVSESWLAFGRSLGNQLGLRHFGVDLRVADPVADPSSATVIEVNASPLLVQLHALGFTEIALAAQVKVLEAIFAAQ